METKHTPTGDDLLVIFADGLDASGDGRGWRKEHQDARNTIVRAVNEREELIAALAMCLNSLDDLSCAYPDDATFDRAGDGFAAVSKSRAILAKARTP